jgi:hypothetical protein
MNEEAYCNGSGTDLGSGTSDEKRECMGYDNYPFPFPSPVKSSPHLTQHEFDFNTIDPVLCPLPVDANLDLTDPVVIAEAHGHVAASKSWG